MRSVPGIHVPNGNVMHAWHTVILNICTWQGKAKQARDTFISLSCFVYGSSETLQTTCSYILDIEHYVLQVNTPYAEAKLSATKSQLTNSPRKVLM